MDKFAADALIEAIDRIAKVLERIDENTSAMCTHIENIECHLSAIGDVISYPGEGAQAVLAVSTGD